MPRLKGIVLTRIMATAPSLPNPLDPATLNLISSIVVSFGFKLLGAIALWIVGSWLIRLAGRLGRRALRTSSLDATTISYLINILLVTLKIVLVVAILGFFGIQTTTFAALLAGAGLAIGAAWSGLLSNFAAGAFLQIFRPFRVGDFINAGGVMGTVEEIGLFVTTINTLQNVRTIVGNAKVFGDNIENYTANPYRRVDLQAQLDHSADVGQAMTLLQQAVQAIPNVLATPAVDVEILEFNPRGVLLTVRPYTHNDSYWQVYFDTNRVIRETLGANGFPVPTEHIAFSGTQTPPTRNGNGNGAAASRSEAV